MATKRIFSSIIFILLIINSIYSIDLLILKDGTVLYGDIISYEKDEQINFMKDDGSTLIYNTSSISSIRTKINYFS